MTLIGASVTGTDPARLDAARATYGDVRIFRTFTSGPPTDKLLPADGTAVCASFKTPDPSALVAFLQAARDRGVTGRWCWHHEPEDDFTTPQAQQSYRDTWTALIMAARTVRRRTLKPLPILMAYTLQPGTGRDWTAFLPPTSVYSGPVGFDCYHTPAQVLADWSLKTGRRFAVPEIGCRQPTDEGRLAWLQANLPPLLAAKPIFVTYFDANVGGDFSLTPYPQASAYWRSLASA
jgi:hypothetical protein